MIFVYNGDLRICVTLLVALRGPYVCDSLERNCQDRK